MNTRQYVIALVLSAGCLVFGILLVMLGQSSQRLQNDLSQQQEEINRGSMSQQIGQNLLRDMGQAALNNEKMRGVLKKNGFDVNPTPSAVPPNP